MTGGLAALPAWLGGTGYSVLTQLAGHQVRATLVFDQDLYLSASVAGAARSLSGVRLGAGQSLFLRSVTSVPEPATWALWLFGIGLLGLRGRCGQRWVRGRR